MDSSDLGKWVESTAEDEKRFAEEALEEARKLERHDETWARRKQSENKKALDKMETKIKAIRPPQNLGGDAKTQAWAEKTMRKEQRRLGKPRGGTEKLMRKIMRQEGKETMEDWVADFGWPQRDAEPQEHRIGKTGFRYDVNAYR